MADPDHWNRVYAARQENALTWFEQDAALSRDLAAHFSTPDQAVLDVGGGASRFVDALVQRGQRRIGVLDLSSEALAASKARLGLAAQGVEWIVADITQWAPSSGWDLWHDRAVFHFLTDVDDRAAYFARMQAALAPDGVAIIATFAPDGPETCSQLPVQRWSSEALAAEAEQHVPNMLSLCESRRHIHLTPKGNRQPFSISVFRRIN